MLDKDMARGWGVNAPTIAPTHYKTRHIRLDEQVWKKLKQKRRKSNLTWNLFIKELIKKQYDNGRVN